MLKISNYQFFYVFKFIFLLLVLIHCQPGLEKYPTDYAFLLLKEKSYNVSLKIINLEGSDLSIQLNYQTPNEIEKTEELLPLKKETEIHSKFSYPSRTKISLKINKQPLNPNQVCTFNKSNVEIFESNVGDIEVNCSNSIFRIWVTNSTTMGNLNGTGGTVGGDSMCNNMADTNHPGSGTYKALIWLPGRTVSDADWPIIANTNYYRSDGITLIGNSNSVKTITSALPNSVNTSAGLNSWSGIMANGIPWMAATDNCSNWTSSLNTVDGIFGTANLTTPGNVFGRNGGPNRSSCDQLLRLYCVEQ